MHLEGTWREEYWREEGRGMREVKVGVVEVMRRHNSLITFISSFMTLACAEMLQAR